MFCPKCGEPQASEEVRFCNKCGFQLAVVTELIAHDGVLAARDAGATTAAATAGEPSPRRRGVQKGLKLIFLTVILLPLIPIVETLFPGVDENTNMDELGQFIFVSLLLIIFLSGLARILYAFTEPSALTATAKPAAAALPAQTGAASGKRALPPRQSIPVTDFATPRHDTAELQKPPSVTERTTNLLNKS